MGKNRGDSFDRKDRVIAVHYGFGEVEQVLPGGRVRVNFEVEGCRTFDCEGYWGGSEDKDESRRIHHVNTGPIEVSTTDHPHIPVDTPLWVWQNPKVKDLSEVQRQHFCRFNKKGLVVCYLGGRTSHSDCGGRQSWRFYSLTRPEINKG